MFTYLPDDKILDLSKLKSFADDILKAAHMAEFVFEEEKTLLEKEKMLVISIFSFSNNVFKILFFFNLRNVWRMVSRVHWNEDVKSSKHKTVDHFAHFVQYDFDLTWLQMQL